MKRLFALFSIAVLCGYSSLPIAAQRFGRQVKDTVASETQLPVNIDVLAYSDGRSTVVTWTDNSTDRAVGFYVYRLGSKGLERISVSPVLGTNPASRTEREPFVERSFRYDGGAVGDLYVVESFGPGGDRRQSAPAASQYASDLAAIAGSALAESGDQTGQKSTRF